MTNLVIINYTETVTTVDASSSADATTTTINTDKYITGYVVSNSDGVTVVVPIQIENQVFIPTSIITSIVDAVVAPTPAVGPTA